MSEEGFIGEHSQQLDPKKRVVFPARFRDQMTERERRAGFFLTKGLDGCVTLFPHEHWLEVSERVRQRSKLNKDFRHFARLFFGKAQEVLLDGQGRLKISGAHLEMAGIEKEVVFVGVGDYVELWSPERFKGYESYHAPDYDEIGAEIFFGSGDGSEVPEPSGASEPPATDSE